jgi:protein gp37
MNKTKIEWAGVTWNPTRGCSKVSAGCKNCYAEAFALRWVGRKGHAYELGFKPRLVPHLLTDPFRVNESDTVFVNSMSDLFHGRFPTAYIKAVLEVVRRVDWLVFQVLTKRADRMRDLMNGPLKDYTELPNLWLGTSVENKEHGVPRILSLRAASARTRFLSVEPLLEDVGTLDLTGIHWVICGGESGPGRREMNVSWARSVRDQCVAAHVPFHFKQFGHFIDNPDKKDTTAKQNGGSAKGGRSLDGRTWDEYPPVFVARAPKTKERGERRRAYETWAKDYLKAAGIEWGGGE